MLVYLRKRSVVAEIRQICYKRDLPNLKRDVFTKRAYSQVKMLYTYYVIYVCVSLSLSLFLSVYRCLYNYVCMHLCMYVYVYLTISMYHTHIHTHTHARMYVYMYIHTCMSKETHSHSHQQANISEKFVMISKQEKDATNYHHLHYPQTITKPSLKPSQNAAINDHEPYGRKKGHYRNGIC